MGYWKYSAILALAAMFPVLAFLIEVLSYPYGKALVMATITYPIIFGEMYVIMRINDTLFGEKEESE